MVREGFLEEEDRWSSLDGEGAGELARGRDGKDSPGAGTASEALGTGRPQPGRGALGGRGLYPLPPSL